VARLCRRALRNAGAFSCALPMSTIYFISWSSALGCPRFARKRQSWRSTILNILSSSFLENRSFDHTVGYLRLPDANPPMAIDGLRSVAWGGTESNANVLSPTLEESSF
jgi:hypothetical protein